MFVFLSRERSSTAGDQGRGLSFRYYAKTLGLRASFDEADEVSRGRPRRGATFSIHKVERRDDENSKETGADPGSTDPVCPSVVGVDFTTPFFPFSLLFPQRPRHTRRAVAGELPERYFITSAGLLLGTWNLCASDARLSFILGQLVQEPVWQSFYLEFLRLETKGVTFLSRILNF